MTPKQCVSCPARSQEANRKHDLSLVEYLVKEVFFYVGLEHLRMSIQLRRHPTIQVRLGLCLQVDERDQKFEWWHLAVTM